MTAYVILEVTFSPTKESADSGAGLPKTGREHSPTHQQERLKVYWTWHCPPKQDSVFPTTSPSYQKACTNLLFIREQTEVRTTIPWHPETKHNHRNLTKMITWITALFNSMKLWAMPCRATQDGWVTVEHSVKLWSTGERMGKPLQYSCLENPMNCMKKSLLLQPEIIVTFSPHASFLIFCIVMSFPSLSLSIAIIEV